MESFPNIYLHLAGNKILISFEQNDHISAKIQKFAGTRFNDSLARWEAPLSVYSSIISEFNNVIISPILLKYFSDENRVIKAIEDLRNKDYYELEDYTPKVPLMTHQKKAFELHRMLKGSANTSAMGAGKTASAICAVHWNIENGFIDNCLIICPKSVLRGWEEQIEFFSNLSYISLGAKDRKERIKRLSYERDIYLINYAQTWRLEKELLEKEFNMVICDEAHRIKDPRTNQSRACYALGDKAEYRIALTGTPVMNSSLDAFGIMRFIDSKVFGESFYSFRTKYFRQVTPEHSPMKIYKAKRGADEIISDKLYTRAIRFLKEECLDLPPYQFLPDRVVTLSKEQEKAYRQMQEELCVELEGKKIKINHVLTMMLKLNQITSGWLKDSDSGEITHFPSNPKFDELKEVVREIDDQPCIIWGYYKADMELIINYYSRCQNEKCKRPTNLVAGDSCPGCGREIKYRCSEVRGGTRNRNAEIAIFRFTQEERAVLRQKFIIEGRTKREIKEELGDLLPDGQEPPQTNIIACQCVAASEGLNLQRATYSIFYSRNYSLKDWTQALARNHRKGQTKKVTYINLVACRKNGETTVDQRISDSLKAKEDLSKRVNKDDIKLLMGNSKKHKEALKDITDLVADEITDTEPNTDKEKGDQQELF